MNKFVTNFFGAFAFNANVKARDDVTAAANEMGYKDIPTYAVFDANEDPAAFTARLDGLSATVGAGDIVVVQYPSCIGYWFDRAFAKRMKERGAKVAVILQDAVVLRSGPHPYGFGDFDETEFFNQMDVVVAHGHRMEEVLRAQGVTTSIISRLVHDCLIDPADLNLSDQLQRKCVFVGSGYKSPFLGTWTNQTELTAFTDKPDNELSPTVKAGGTHPFNELVRQIPRDRFGILWDSDDENGEKFQNYTRYSAPHKMGLYLSLGLPVICWEDSATAEVVRRYGVGFAIKSLDEIDDLLASQTDEDLKALKARVNRFGDANREGFFMRKTLIEIEEILLIGNKTSQKDEKENTENLKVAVSISKDMGLIVPDGYRPIASGPKARSTKEKHFDYLVDYSLDNIADKHSHYAELTSLYWIWKNSTSPIKGLMPYNRFLYPDETDNILSSKQISKDLESNDLIVEQATVLDLAFWGIESKYGNHYGRVHGTFELLVLYRTLKKLYPDYCQSLMTVLTSKSFHAHNILIGKKELVDEYCEWLFTILSEVEKNLNLTTFTGNQAGVMSFLAECLLNVFIEYRKLKVVEYRSVEEDSNFIVKQAKQSDQLVRLSRRELVKSVFQFGGIGLGIFAEQMALNEDGTISGYSHPNERFWTIIDDQLTFLNSDKAPTSRLPLSTYSGYLFGKNIWGGTIFLKIKDFPFAQD